MLGLYRSSVIGSAKALVNTSRGSRGRGSVGAFRSIFIDSESTPNPHSMKFLPGSEVLPEMAGTGMFFQKKEVRDMMKSPLASNLFKVDGVKGVFLGRDFITVTKTTDQTWQVLKPQLFSVILDFLSEGKPAVLMDSEMPVSDTEILDTDSEVVATVKELLETRIRPAVQEDGGDIYYEGFDDITGTVYLRLAGSCVGCPSSSATLRGGVENMLMHYVPEVKQIEEVAPHEEEDDNTDAPTMEFKPNVS